MSFCRLIQFTAVALTQKAFGWASMIPLSHLSFAQGGQVKCRPKKRIIIKVSHSVVAEVCVGGGGGGG